MAFPKTKEDVIRAEQNKKYGIELDADGNAVTVEVEHSPLSDKDVLLMRKAPIKMRMLQTQRPKDLLAHKQFIRKRGPQVEAEFGVSAREIFLKGNSAMGSQLMAASPEAYKLLKEFAFWI